MLMFWAFNAIHYKKIKHYDLFLLLKFKRKILFCSDCFLKLRGIKEE